MNSGSDNSTSSTIMMIPYLHFMGGDRLFFEVLHPSSAGAIVGASIALAILAMAERWLNTTKKCLEARWDGNLNNPSVPKNNDHPSHPLRGQSDNGVTRTSYLLAGPAFVAARDVPRGVIQALHALLSYALMLAVMTFQASYIISIVIGSGFGEMIFGRIRVSRS